MSIEDEIPLFRISIRTASRLIADSLSEWNGDDISEEDHESFQRTDVEHESDYIWPHEFKHAEPAGKMKAACEGIEVALVNAVNQGHIVPREVRRTLAGIVKPDETELDIHDVSNWCETVGINPSESFYQYIEDEEKIAGNVFQQVADERFELENRKALTESSKATSLLSQDEISKVLIENLRFREGHFRPEFQSREKLLTNRERRTLLTIIAALAKAAKINIDAPGKAALFIEGLTAEMGTHVSKRAIEDHLKKIPNALETRMK